MDTVTLLAPAKINLSLDVGAVMPNGYHPVTTVMQAVSLCDTVCISRQGSEIRLTASDPTLACGEKNTAYRAARAFCEQTGLSQGLSIHLQKNIPMQAGLAGGSTDAAAVLKGCNRLFGNPLTAEQLHTLAASIGADVPFCLFGGTQLGTGIGTALSPAPAMPHCFIVIAKPDIGVSTAEAYLAIDQAPPATQQDTPAVLDALQRGDLSLLAAAVGNRFEQVLSLEPVQTLCAQMRQMGALSARMSGSGSAVFGLFDCEQQAARCAEHLSKTVFSVLCHPVASGWEG